MRFAGQVMREESQGRTIGHESYVTPDVADSPAADGERGVPISP